MAQITYNDKVALNVNSDIADINKVNASDMNEIKASVNNNDDMLNGNAVAGDMVVNSIRTKNMFDKNTIAQGDIVNGTPTLRMSSRQALWLKAGTYTFSTNMTNSYNYSLTTNAVGSPPLSSYPTYDINTSWQNSSTYTITLTSSGWFVLSLRRSDNGTITSADITNLKSFNYQLEKGSTATAYTPFQDLNPNVSDTGWLPATLTSNFAPYQNWNGNTPKYRKIGNVVNIRGVITPTTTLSTTADQVMFSVPLEYAPPFEVRIICQGSGMNRWMLSVFNTGNVAISRYGINSQDNITSGNWLPFSVVYFTD